MSDNKPAADVDVTKEWRARHDQKGAATRLRLFAAVSWIVAIGTPFGFDRTVTAGVVSAYPRYIHGSSIPLIQSDVVMNPGSSGGPLFDGSGALVGMGTMIFSDTGVYVGVSFALPVGELMRVAQALRTRGAVRIGDIGIRTQPVTADLAAAFGHHGMSGALVARVAPDGPAGRAGLKAGDIVLGLAHGERLMQPEIESRVSSAAPGTQLALDVWRDGAVLVVQVKVASATAEAPGLPPLPPASRELRLGLGLTALTTQVPGRPAGLYVESATGSALLAGLERGDRIVAVNTVAVASIAEFDAALAQAAPRKVVALLVARSSTLVYVPVSPEGLAP